MSLSIWRGKAHLGLLGHYVSGYCSWHLEHFLPVIKLWGTSPATLAVGGTMYLSGIRKSSVLPLMQTDHSEQVSVSKVGARGISLSMLENVILTAGLSWENMEHTKVTLIWTDKSKSGDETRHLGTEFHWVLRIQKVREYCNSLDITSFNPWHAYMLFLNTPKSYRHRNSSVTICFFPGCWAGSTPWLIVWKILCQSCSILCSCPQSTPVQPQYPDQSSHSSFPSHSLDCFQVPLGQRQSSACSFAGQHDEDTVSAYSFYVVFGMRWRTYPQRTSYWQWRAQCIPSFCFFSLLFPLLFTTCHSRHIFPHWSWNLTCPKMRMWDEISGYSSYCPSFLFCCNHWTGVHIHVP